MKAILITACACLLTGFGLARLNLRDEPPLVKAEKSSVPSKPPVSAMATVAPILADQDATSRRARLRAWADGIETSRMAALLNEIQKNPSAHVRSELRQALLFSWTSRDLVAVTKWFGTLGLDYDLHQEGRDQLVLALLQCNPSDVLPVLQTSLPVSVSQELYGPYFRAWAATAPDAAAATLSQLADAERKSSAVWQDLISQVTAQWMQTAPDQAIAWVQAMPEGAAKSKTEIQVAYRWTELDPVAASAYAAKAGNLQLVKTIAGKWAETSPADALGWAHTLPEGAARSRAMSAAATAWAQSDPQAAARYATVIESPAQRADVTAAVASAWAFADPQSAGAWVKTLPADPSRDSAVGVLCDAFRFNAPDQAFTWARALAEPTLRDHTITSVAVTWLKQEPAAARDAITRSTLSEELKASIFAQATSPHRDS